MISSFGRLWSLNKNRELPPRPGKYGHLFVILSKPGSKIKQFSIHRLVLTAFVGPCPEGMVGRHFPDRNPANNHLENLSWATRTVNQRDRIFHGTSNRGEQSSSVKLTEADVIAIRKWHKRKTKKKTINQVAVEHGVVNRTIQAIVYGRTWKHLL
jgi:hypothetical protein